MWNERGWNPDDKRIILEAISYLLRLDGEDCQKALADHVRALDMRKEEREMMTMFEEVAMREGRESGAREKAVEMAKNLLTYGVSPDIISKSSGLPLDEIRSLMN